VAVLGAAAASQIPALIPIALKDISELNPSATEYIVDWLFFTIVRCSRWRLALFLLLVARERAERLPRRLESGSNETPITMRRRIVILLAASLLRTASRGAN